MNYYNEIDPKAAAWIQELINEGLIPNGKIDTRSIVDVQPGDLRGFTQAHFFCGIAGWSRALRLAGWPDDREIWSGSCPCQPFSEAGKGEGLNDERHLWPYFYRLICACRPRVVIGEQVASSLVVGKTGRKADSESPVWIDGVCADMEAARYAFGATDLPAAGIGAPHIRQRLYWVAYSELPNRRAEREIDGNAHGRNGLGWSSNTCRLADSECSERREIMQRHEHNRNDAGRNEEASGIGACCKDGGLGNTESERCGEAWAGNGRSEKRFSDPSKLCGMGEPIPAGLQGHSWDGDHGSQSGRNGTVEAGSVAEAGESSGVEDSGSDVGKLSTGKRNGPDEADSSRASSEPPGRSAFGFWSDATWHLCRDGKSRRIPSGSESVFQRMADELPENLDGMRLASYGFPLAPKVQGRSAILKGYGNAIVPELAAEFIKAVMQEI